MDNSNKVYFDLLEGLSITDSHLESFSARGLAPPDVEALGYKTYPISRKSIIHKLETVHKQEGLLGVAGFWLGENGKIQLSGATGIAIPVRNFKGDIQGVKIRADKPLNPASKYSSISSNPKADKSGKVKYTQGTSAKAQMHYPLSKPTDLTTIRITEGELKADITNSLTDIYTISLPGVNLWRQALPAVKKINPQRVLLAFDSDKETEEYDVKDGEAKEPKQYAVGLSLAKLYNALTGAGYEVAIEDWPEEAGKGIDDVIVSGNEHKIREMDPEEALEWVEEALKNDLSSTGAEWAYVIGVKRFYHCDSLYELDKEMFSDKYMHLGAKVLPATEALSDPNFMKYDMPVYTPAEGPAYDRGGIKYFNTWRGNKLKPAVGEVEVFLNHCEHMIPDKVERNIFIDYLAYCVQNPGKKIRWAMLLQGAQGTGKSYFGELMRGLLGEKNVSSPSNEAIHEPYTSWLKSCELVVVEELMARGRLDLMNKLKPMITQDIATVREMYKVPYEQPNVFNLLMFTNHEDAIIIDSTDRRYCVIFSRASPKPPAYYAELFGWTAKNLGKVLHYMKQRDLSAFMPNGHAPMTTGKKELIDQSLPPLQAWMKEAIEEESWPFVGDLVTTSHLAACLPRAFSNSSPQAVGRALSSIGGVNLGQYLMPSGQNLRLWAVRRSETWASTSNKVVAAEYAKWGQDSMPGGNPLLESKPM